MLHHSNLIFMHRFYLPPDECQKDSISLSERESRHALNVLRIRPRDRVVVLNGAGDEMLCEVREAGRRAVTLMIVRKNPIPPLPCQVTLAQAVTPVTASQQALADPIYCLITCRTSAEISTYLKRRGIPWHEVDCLPIR